MGSGKSQHYLGKKIFISRFCSEGRSKTKKFFFLQGWSMALNLQEGIGITYILDSKDYTKQQRTTTTRVFPTKDGPVQKHRHRVVRMLCLLELRSNNLNVFLTSRVSISWCGLARSIREKRKFVAARSKFYIPSKTQINIYFSCCWANWVVRDVSENFGNFAKLCIPLLWVFFPKCISQMNINFDFIHILALKCTFLSQNLG
jgi:hypothetical protein